MSRGTRLALAALCLAAAAGCPPRPAAPDGRGGRRSSEPGGTSERLPPVPPGVRLVSFDAERATALPGGHLEPAWCVQLTALVRDASGRPAEGVPVGFSLDRRGGYGTVLGAALSHDLALSDASGAARTILVSSDRAELCRTYATCGPAMLAATVEFGEQKGSPLTVGLGAVPEPQPESGLPEPELDARVAHIVRQSRSGGEAARRALAEISAMGREAVAPLLRMVYDESRPAEERRLAGQALAAVRDELVLDRLLRSLDDPRAAVRGGAEVGLIERGEARAGRGVRRAVQAAGPLGRASALRVLAAWGGPGDAAILAARAGADPDPLVRATAAWKLKTWPDRAESRAALRAALADGSAFVRYSAAKALALLPAFAREEPPPMDARALLAEPDARVRAAAARACRSPALADALLELSSERDVRVRRGAVEGLGHLPAESSPAAWRKLQDLARDRDEVVAATALRALVRRGGADVAGFLLDGLAGDDAALAAEALDSLERSFLVEFDRPRPGAPPGEDTLQNWGAWVRACRSLGEAERLWLAADRRDSRLRGEAVLALASRPETEPEMRRRAGELARAMVGEIDVRVRAPASAALWLLGDERGSRTLLRDLGAEDWAARHAACRAAAAVRDPDVAEALVRLLGDESAAIRTVAHRALLAIRGGDAGDGFDPEGPADERGRSAALWKKWAADLRIRTTREPEKPPK